MDTVTLYAEAGDGGSGCCSFRREKFIPYGGPDGGDGGHGGDVILRGNRDDSSLLHIFYAPHQRAERGVHGKGKCLYGQNGKDCVVTVPLGTEVWDTEANVMLGDIVAHGQDLTVARGGRGGWGNPHWKTATHQAPREHTPGEPGERKTLRLKLKIIADLGLVGLPNAGKSSLLTVLSDAHPKVAAYPFTTLNPIIGTMMVDGYAHATLADIPGLIEGAHQGVGLGDAFLRHVERAGGLIHVVDMAAVDGRRPEDDFRTLLSELDQYQAGLAARPHLVVANKMDLPESAENLKRFKKETGVTPLPVSAVTGEGIERLKTAIRALLKGLRAET
jgi:GTP-binding protein